MQSGRYFSQELHVAKEEVVESNRAASKKFFAQLNQSLRNSSTEGDSTRMLHRSPSGAKRKIRQREERVGSRPSPFLPSSSSSSSTSVTPPILERPPTKFGTLIDSHGYESILSDPRLPGPTTSSPSHSTVSPTSRMTSSSPSGSPLCMPSPFFTSNPPSKPTVEVHPMPCTEVEGRHEQRREKPAVPAKPKGLLSISSILPTSPCPLGRSSSSLSSLRSQPLSFSSSYLVDSLLSSTTFSSSIRGSSLEEEKAERAEKTAAQLKRRIQRLQEEAAFLSKEQAANDEIHHVLLSAVALHCPSLHDKVQRSIQREREIAWLETKLELSSLSQPEDQRVVSRQLGDLAFLKKVFASSDAQLFQQVAGVLGHEQASIFQSYRESMVKMLVEKKEIERRMEKTTEELRSLLPD